MQLKKVEKISGISSADFIKNYMNKGVPVILDDFVSKDSPAWTKWSYDYFKEIAGDAQISLHGREDASNDRAASAPVAKMKFGEYLDLIEREPTDLRIFLFNLMKLKPELNHDLIYNDVTGGKVLKWLPYLFFGGEGSSTRNHFDIDMSHVFLTQYKGIKKIWLFPLEQSDLMYKLPYNFHSIANLKTPNYEKFPALRFLNGYEAEIHPGETLFMPSGWWHYIQYVTEGYSISVRALPSKVYDRWRGFRNLVITRNFDNTMRKIFKDRWFNYKISTANKRAEKALRRVK
ncbi:cupin-like domain-containing protein [Parapedobacter sp. ISTM3]|uniref:Cupin-like domain-containing protein n=1 Tax=Parapedobacter luteus TaxID=623280 RepID=A0A1T5EMB2_9SPHI|nr:cupin-like domain-containing protein [Parapedobacter luteus]MBK1441303.1 cupin-like domain-containing protein [Parapedobacter sp. ISTM3]SKB85097.1 Cupin-like domain-containing protein [Parapedobacter luteus]